MKDSSFSDISSSATDLSSAGQGDSYQLAQIDVELEQLEQRFVNIEMRIKEDVEAEEIGIEVFVSKICLGNLLPIFL